MNGKGIDVRRSIFLLAMLLAAGARPAGAAIDISPAAPATTDPIELILFGSCSGCVIHFEALQPAGEKRFLIRGTTNHIVDPPLVAPYLERFTLDPLPASGNYRIDVEVDGKPYDSLSFFVAPADPFLRFHDARVSVRVGWKIPGGPGQGTGKPILLTPESGYFYFFDWRNIELTVKLLDGRAVNGHRWLFIASMTTLELEIEVTGCPPEGLPQPCVEKTYVQPPGQNHNFVDISTFF